MRAIGKARPAIWAALGVFVGVLAFSGAPALAALTYGPITGRIGNVGVAGSGEGEFSTPDGIAVAQATGDLYVVDMGNNRVEKFGPLGEYIAQFNGSDAPGGPFETPSAVAVDNDSTSLSYGDVYVADSGHNIVDKFTPAGTYVPGSQLTGQPVSAPEPKAFSDPDGLAVDSTSGDLYVADKNNKLIDIFTSAGAWESTFATPEGKPWALAVDSNGYIYVAAAGAERVTEFAPLGASVVRFFSESNGGFGHARTVGVDLEDDDAFLGTEINGVYQIEEVNASGELTAQRNFGGEEEMTAPHATSPGIAVDSASGTVYAVDAGNDVVDVFARVVLPTVETITSSAVKGTTATVSGAVNPEGVEAHYFFEYGPCNGNNLSLCSESGYPLVSSEEALKEPAGSTSEPASALLTGLSPETTYHYRLVGKNANGENQGKEESFTTGPAVTGVSTCTETDLAPFSATLNALLEPEGVETHYRFEYVSSEEYANSPVYTHSSELETSVAADRISADAPIAELEPGTTYHCRLFASNEHGETFGPEQTFTTPPAVPIVDDKQPSFATGVAPHEAILHGTVNPGRGITTYHFMYGPTAAYGFRTPEAYTQLNYEDDAIEQLVTGLPAGIIVHYALVASNASGTIVGSDEELRTLESPLPLVETSGPSGPSLEVTSLPSGFAQPGTPALLSIPSFPPEKIVTPPSLKCKKGYVKKSGKCVKKKSDGKVKTKKKVKEKK